MGARCRGFSLLEVLVALAVLALAAGVLFQIFASGSRSAGIIESRGVALAIAESVMAETWAEEELEPGESGGEVAGTPPMVWRRTVVEFEGDGSLDDDQLLWLPLQVVVEVAWGEGASERSVSLATLRLVDKGP